MSDANIAVIRRFYEELWNRGDLAVAQEILEPEIRFRGSFGTTIEGLPAFMRYVEQTRAAFPDWHNRIDELIAAEEKVVARLTWTGTHQGEFFGIAPTGLTVAYVGAAIFEVRREDPGRLGRRRYTGAVESPGGARASRRRPDHVTDRLGRRVYAQRGDYADATVRADAGRSEGLR
jgi:predicted ester cyclase